MTAESARAEEYTASPRAHDAGDSAVYLGSGSSIVSLTRPIKGRTMTLPAGTRLVGLYPVEDGRWVVVFNGAQFRVWAVAVENGHR